MPSCLWNGSRTPPESNSSEHARLALVVAAVIGCDFAAERQESVCEHVVFSPSVRLYTVWQCIAIVGLMLDSRAADGTCSVRHSVESYRVLMLLKAIVLVRLSCFLSLKMAIMASEL